MGDVGAEEGYDTWEPCLGKSHCGPWAFDKNDPTMSVVKGTVGVIEHLPLGETGGKAPLAEACDSVRVEASAAIADCVPPHVVETHGDGPFEEGALGVWPTGLELYGRFDLDTFGLLKERRPGIEWDSTPEGRKGVVLVAP